VTSHQFNEFCEILPTLQTTAQSWDATTTYFEKLGIDGLLYADIGPHAPRIMTSLKSDWTEHYTDQAYIEVDPFFMHCCNSYAAMDIGPDCVPDHDYMSNKEKQFIADASDTGLVAGFASPVRVKSKDGLTGWSFLSSHGRGLVDELRRTQELEMRLVGTMVHQHMSELIAAPAAAYVLSARETEALQWTAQGLRTARIAEKMSLREVTVELHLRNARKKLGANTRDHAVARALVSGLITL